MATTTKTTNVYQSSLLQGQSSLKRTWKTGTYPIFNEVGLILW